VRCSVSRALTRASASVLLAVPRSMM
jgi:hypothetical protein